MNKKLFISLLIGMFFLNIQICFGQKNKPKLFEVKKIYIERIDDKKYEKFYESLTNELRRKLVFTVVSTIEEADSILKIDFLFEIIIHSEKGFFDPVFRCNLSSKSQDLIWKKDITIDTKGNTEADNYLAAQIIANKLLKDWLKSDRQKKKST